MEQRDNTEPTAAIVELMGLHRGDVFTWNGQAYKVESIDERMGPRDRDSLTVSDPTISHPQDGRYGQWGVPLFDVFKDWLNYDVHPGRVEVSTDG